MAEKEKIIQPDFQTPNLAITVDDGSVSVPIRNRQGEEIGVFSFRPTDVGIVERYKNMTDEFDAITAPLENININNDGTADDDDDVAMAAMKEAENRLFAACNKLFGGDMAAAFFGKMHPFSPIGGHFYCENALNAVGQFISQQFDVELKQVNSRVSKYTHGIKTGKHRNGTKK